MVDRSQPGGRLSARIVQFQHAGPGMISARSWRGTVPPAEDRQEPRARGARATPLRETFEEPSSAGEDDHEATPWPVQARRLAVAAG